VVRDTVEGYASCGGIDGVLGFSQGATLASLLSTDLGSNKVGWSPDYSILITGRCSLIAPEWYHGMHDGPSLHVWGKNDKVVPGSQSRKLSSRFDQSSILVHDRGHVPPQDKEAIGRVAQFVLELAPGG